MPTRDPFVPFSRLLFPAPSSLQLHQVSISFRDQAQSSMILPSAMRCMLTPVAIAFPSACAVQRVTTLSPSAMVSSVTVSSFVYMVTWFVRLYS